MLFTSKTKFGNLRCSILKNCTFFAIVLNTQRFSLNYCYFLFQKYDNFLPIFVKKLNFGLLVWTICVTPEIFDIGGSESIIWSPPSSNHLVIGPLLASVGRKNLFFCPTGGWWNNHLQMCLGKGFPVIENVSQKDWKECCNIIFLDL